MQYNNLYMAIRESLSNGEEHFLLSEITVHEEETKDKVNQTAALHPEWHKKNPVLRIIKVRIEG